MVRPVDSSDFHLQAEGSEKIHQIKKADPETEKRQFNQELAKRMKDQKDSPGENEATPSKPDQKEKDSDNPTLDHHIDLTA